MNALNWEIKQVQGDKFLGADGPTLVADMQAYITGLQGLGATIAASTSLDTVNADNALIITTYRVYDFMLPMVRDVVQADWASNVGLPDIAKALSNLQGQESAGNQSVLGPLFSNIQSQQQTATTAVSGLSAEFLGYTAADWISNHGLLNTPGSDIFVADRAIRTAEKDCSRAYDYLRWLHNHGNGTTTTSSTTTSTTVAPTTTTTVAPTTTTVAVKGKHGHGRGHGGPRCGRHSFRCVAPPAPPRARGRTSDDHHDLHNDAYDDDRGPDHDHECRHHDHDGCARCQLLCWCYRDCPEPHRLGREQQRSVQRL